jgi:Fe-S cluster biogenesis protein NfuA
MQMGIERVLRENFPNLGQVLQVTTNDDGKEEVGKPSELTVDMVMLELNRIGPAISAMGGNYELVRIDPSLGLVELKFKGPNKLQQGLELALLDIPLCKYVKFTIYDDNY